MPQRDPQSSSSGEERSSKPADLPQAMLSAVFSDAAPKHLLDGVASGVMETVKGVAVGAGVFGMSVYAGVQQGSAARVASGVAAGVLGFVGLSLYGAGCGVKKVVQGTLNTSKAIEAAMEGDRVWDEGAAAFVRVNVSELSKNLPPTDEDIFDAARMKWLEDSRSAAGDAAESAEPLRGTEHYTVLGVPKDASKQEIRKAFAAKALVLHPDKNPDPQCAREFQRVNEAYRVLSDACLRAQYDAGELKSSSGEGASSSDPNGASGGASLGEWSPLEEVLMWRLFAPWVGRPRYLLMLHPRMRFDGALAAAYESRKCSRAALHLLSMVERTSFADIEAQADDMCGSSRLGCDIVEMIAESYETVLRQCGQRDAIIRNADTILWSAVTSLTHVANVATTLGRTASHAYHRTMEESHVHTMLLTACASDIRHVSSNAAFMLLADCSAAPEEKESRAHQLVSVVTLMKAAVARHRAVLQRPLLQDGAK